jgi:hypothetical protein
VAYRAAVTASPQDMALLDELYAFAVRCGQWDAADWALQQGVARDRENPDRLVRYGDFLADVKKSDEAAIAAYQQALLWRPDDAAVKSKIAEIKLAQGAAHDRANERALAETGYREALKFAPPGSDVHARIQAELQRLKALRGN